MPRADVQLEGDALLRQAGHDIPDEAYLDDNEWPFHDWRTCRRCGQTFCTHCVEKVGRADACRPHESTPGEGS